MGEAMSITIYHNPRCSKSRETLALIESKSLTPQVIDYLRSPPSASELKSILRKLGLKPRDILRKGEPRCRELDIDALDDAALIELMAANPILIERPIVVHGDKAALGRPPANVLKIL